MYEEALVLCPIDPAAAPGDFAGLVRALQALGLIDAAAHSPYRAGPRAAGLLSWIGCSPVPATDGNLIAIVAPGEYPQLLAEHCTRAPACRHCRAPLPHWQALIAAAGDDPAHYHAPCLDCGHTQTLAELRWHERAAFGRIGIAIFGVGEGLAVPGDELLHLLAAHTGGPWRHFYDRRYRPRSLT